MKSNFLDRFTSILPWVASIVGLIVIVASLWFLVPVFTESDLMKENAEIVAMNYIAESSETIMMMQYDPCLKMSVMRPMTTFHPAQYNVTIKCEQHNRTFVLNDQKIYEKVKCGQKITLGYVEEYKAPRTKQEEKTLYDYHTKVIELEGFEKVER